MEIKIDYDTCNDIVKKINKCVRKLEDEVELMKDGLSYIKSINKSHRIKSEIINSINIKINARNIERQRLIEFSKRLDSYANLVADADKGLSRIMK